MFGSLNMSLEGKVLVVKDRSERGINSIFFVSTYSFKEIIVPVFYDGDISLSPGDLVKVHGLFWTLGEWGVVYAERVEKIKIISKKTNLGAPFFYGTGKIVKVTTSPYNPKQKILNLSFGNLDDSSFLIFGILPKGYRNISVYKGSCLDVGGKAVKTNILSMDIYYFSFRGCEIVTSTTAPLIKNPKRVKELFEMLRIIVRDERLDDDLMRLYTKKKKNEAHLETRKELKELRDEESDETEADAPEIANIEDMEEDDEGDIIIQF